MAREIDTSIALGSRVVSTEPNKRCFGRNRKRDLDVRKQDLIGDSRHDRYENKVYVLPKNLDEKVAYLHLGRLGADLTSLTERQAEYLGIPSAGPFKSDAYRY